jgi:hypothetical protein
MLSTSSYTGPMVPTSANRHHSHLGSPPTDHRAL